MNKKHKNEAMNRAIQNIVFSMLQVYNAPSIIIIIIILNFLIFINFFLLILQLW